MDHSEELQQAGYRLLHQLHDDIQHFSAEELSREAIVRRGREISSKESAPAIQEHLATLTEVIEAYLAGRASEDALEYYLLRQFHIELNTIEGLLTQLARLQQRSRGNREPAA